MEAGTGDVGGGGVEGRRGGGGGELKVQLARWVYENVFYLDNIDRLLILHCTT